MRALMASGATKDAHLDTAAPPAPLIVAVSLLPVVVLICRWSRAGPSSAADRVTLG